MNRHPPYVSGRLAFSFALGLMAFAPSPVLANVDANTSMTVQQQKQSINGVVKDANGDPVIGASILANGTLLLLLNTHTRVRIHIG